LILVVITVRAALGEYENAMAVVDSLDADLELLKEEVDHMYGFQDQVVKLLAYATDTIIKSHELPSEQQDAYEEHKLSEQITTTSFKMEGLKVKSCESVDSMGEICKLADRAHYYARHCWYDLAEKECKQTLPKMRESKRFVVEHSRQLIALLSEFEKCEMVHEEAALATHKAKKSFAHIQTEKRAASGHDAYKNYNPEARGNRGGVIPPPVAKEKGHGHAPPTSIQPFKEGAVKAASTAVVPSTGMGGRRASAATFVPPPPPETVAVGADFDDKPHRRRSSVRMTMKDLLQKKKSMGLLAHHLKQIDEQGDGDGDGEGEGEGEGAQGASASSRFPSKRKPVKKGDKSERDAIKKKLIEAGYQIREKGADAGGKFTSIADIEASKAAAIAAAEAEVRERIENEVVLDAQRKMKELDLELEKAAQREVEAKERADNLTKHAWQMAREEEARRRKHEEEEALARRELIAKHLSAAEEAKELARLDKEKLVREHEDKLAAELVEREQLKAELEEKRLKAIAKETKKLFGQLRDAERVAATAVMQTHKHARATEDLMFDIDHVDALGDPITEEELKAAGSAEDEAFLDSADARIVAFYAAHAKEKIHSLPATLAKYRGKETELLSKLHERYKVAHDPSEKEKEKEKEKAAKKGKKEEKEKEKAAVDSNSGDDDDEKSKEKKKSASRPSFMSRLGWGEEKKGEPAAPAPKPRSSSGRDSQAAAEHQKGGEKKEGSSKKEDKKKSEKKKSSHKKHAAARAVEAHVFARGTSVRVFSTQAVYVFCYTFVLPSFLVCDLSASFSLIHLLPPACIL
jgi:hypothetical protein